MTNDDDKDSKIAAADEKAADDDVDDDDDVARIIDFPPSVYLLPVDERPVCPYDGVCYWKNPQHFLDMHHPSKDTNKESAENEDVDEEMEQQEDDDDGGQLEDPLRPSFGTFTHTIIRPTFVYLKTMRGCLRT